MTWDHLHEACALMAGTAGQGVSFGGAVIAAANTIVGNGPRTVNEAAIALAQNFSGQSVMSASAAFNYLVTPDAASKTLFNAFSTAPTGARAIVIDNAVIKGMQADGNWTAMDVIYLLAAHSEQAGRLNIKAPSTFVLTVGASAPAFVVNRGIDYDGIDDWDDTGFNPSTSGGSQSQNSMSIGHWSLTAGQLGASVSGQFDGTDGTTLLSRDSLDRMQMRANQASPLVSSNGTVTSGLGLFYSNRTLSNAVQGGRNGVQIVSGSNASTMPNSITLSIGTATRTTFSAIRIAAFFYGASRTATQHLQIYNRLLSYMRAVGAV